MTIEIGGVLSARAVDKDPIVGIDLGTTYSLVAVMDGGRPRVLADGEGRALVPSWVTFDGEGAPAVGWEGRERSIGSAARSVYSVKRLIGRGMGELESEVAALTYPVVGDERGTPRIPIPTRGVDGSVETKPYSAPEISALVLGRLKAMAEAALGEPVRKAVITVPAYFNDSQRQATRFAGRLAGFEVPRIVNEPTAAALAYGLGREEGETIAVYDLGGGTFDISVLRLEKGVFQVLSTNGDTRLGGDDFDRGLMEVVLDAMPADTAAQVRADPEWRQALRFACTGAKHALTEAESTAFVAQLPGGPRIELTLSRDQFEAVIAPWVEKTLVPCRQALNDAGLTPADLDHVVLVGGSTRVPLVRRAVEAFFGRRPNADLDPDRVVALGAAVQADVLSGRNRDVLLLDVTPLSLGIESYGGGFCRLIDRNTVLPAMARETFTNFADGQNAVDIHVLQGEREMAGDNRSLARFALRGLPALPANTHRIEVTFLIDANGILSVSARDLRTGAETGIEVKPTYGLSDREVEALLEQSFDRASEDFDARELAEARVEADRILQEVHRQWDRGLPLVDEGTRESIEAAVAWLEEVKTGGDPQAIRDGIDQLDQATREMAHRIMDQAIGAALKDKELDSL